MNQSELAGNIYIDFKNDFDKLLHFEIVQILKSFGASGSPIAWLMDFHDQRTSKRGLMATYLPKMFFYQVHLENCFRTITNLFVH